MAPSRPVLRIALRGELTQAFADAGPEGHPISPFNRRPTWIWETNRYRLSAN